jgi:hypothetical protein
MYLYDEWSQPRPIDKDPRLFLLCFLTPLKHNVTSVYTAHDKKNLREYLSIKGIEARLKFAEENITDYQAYRVLIDFLDNTEKGREICPDDHPFHEFVNEYIRCRRSLLSGKPLFPKRTLRNNSDK